VDDERRVFKPADEDDDDDVFDDDAFDDVGDDDVHLCPDAFLFRARRRRSTLAGLTRALYNSISDSVGSIVTCFFRRSVVCSFNLKLAMS